MINKTTAFLFGCKNLYTLGIHPFDFSKSHTKEYKGIIKLGKDMIKEIGIQSFAELIMESQYRVDIWSSFITIEFGKPEQKEIMKISGTETIFSSCLGKIEQNEINELPADIVKNKNNWIRNVKAIYDKDLS